MFETVDCFAGAIEVRGYGDGGSSVPDIGLLRACLGDRIGVDPSCLGSVKNTLSLRSSWTGTKHTYCRGGRMLAKLDSWLFQRWGKAIGGHISTSFLWASNLGHKPGAPVLPFAFCLLVQPQHTARDKIVYHGTGASPIPA